MTEPLYCPHYHHLVELLGRRWTGAIVRVLAAGPARFGDIRDEIPGLSDRLLTSRLCELESEGLISRCRAAGTNCYGLTGKGRDVLPALDELGRVATRWATRDDPVDRPGRIRA